MIKILDVDKLFDKYIEGYVYENIGKVKPEEIENEIPNLYVAFGDEKLDELDGKTPNTYYRDFSTLELLTCLKAHIEKGVSVSDFLCEAITSKESDASDIIKELDASEDEEYIAYLMNFISEMGIDAPAYKYLEFALYDYSENLGELATEFLCGKANAVKESVLEAVSSAEGRKKERLVEILSHAEKDDRIFDILIAEFCKHTDNLPLYCSFLIKYGDDRALPFLIKVIEDEKINYADFEELRFAIEALGGEYAKERDFSKDRFYKKIKGERNKKVLN